eukprot:6475983-Amphidinium_carterae.2
MQPRRASQATTSNAKLSQRQVKSVGVHKIPPISTRPVFLSPTARDKEHQPCRASPTKSKQSTNAASCAKVAWIQRRGELSRCKRHHANHGPRSKIVRELQGGNV